MADTPPQPANLGPMPYERLNPSPDVQAKVAAAVQACTDWRPENGTSIYNALAKRGTVESQVCDVLDQWPKMYKTYATFDYTAGLSLGFVLAFAILVIWRVFRWFFEDVPGSYVVARLVGYAAAGAVFGVGIATLSLAFSLSTFHATNVEQLADQVFHTWAGAVQVASPICAAAYVLWGGVQAGYLRRLAGRSGGPLS